MEHDRKGGSWKTFLDPVDPFIREAHTMHHIITQIPCLLCQKLPEDPTLRDNLLPIGLLKSLTSSWESNDAVLILLSCKNAF